MAERRYATVYSLNETWNKKSEKIQTDLNQAGIMWGKQFLDWTAVYMSTSSGCIAEMSWILQEQSVLAQRAVCQN